LNRRQFQKKITITLQPASKKLHCGPLN